MTAIRIKKNDEQTSSDIKIYISKSYSKMVFEKDPLKSTYNMMIEKYRNATSQAEKIKIRNYIVDMFMPVFINLSKDYVSNDLSLDDLIHECVIQFISYFDEYTKHDYVHSLLIYTKVRLKRYLNGLYDDEYCFVYEDDGYSIDETIYRDLLTEEINSVLDTLTPREKEVIVCRYGYGMLSREVAERFHVCSARIGQIEKKAIKKLRHPSRSRYLRDYKDIF